MPLETNETQEKQKNLSKFCNWFRKNSKKITIITAILILISTVAAGGYYYYLVNNKPKAYPEIEVKNNGWDPKDPEKKELLDKYQLYLTDRNMIEAKIKMKEMSKINLSGIDGGNFVIFDFREKKDFDKDNLSQAINVTPESFLEQVDQIPLEDTVFLISYGEKDEDINWATRACLMQGHFNPIGLRGGISKVGK